MALGNGDSGKSIHNGTPGKLNMRTVTFWASLGMIFIIPWEGLVTVEGMGTVSKAAGLLVGVLWVASIIGTGRFRRPHPFHLLVFLFVLWNAVSVLWSVDVDGTLSRSLIYFRLFAMVYMIWDLYRTPAALKAALQAYVLGGYVSIGSTIVNFNEAVTVTAQRFSATGFNANLLPLVLALGVPVAWHLAVSEGQNRKAIPLMLRLVNYAYVPAAVFAILLTGSRGGFLATLPVFVFIVGSLTQLKLHLRVSLFAGLIGALLAVLAVVPESSFQRLATIDEEIAEGDLTGRVNIWRTGTVIFSQHPFLGVGGGSFDAETGKSAHNVYLSLLTDLGIVGFSLFVLILAMVVYQGRYLPKRYSRLWVTILVVWLVASSTISTEHKKYTWLFLSLVVVNISLFIRRDETRLTTTRAVDSK